MSALDSCIQKNIFREELLNLRMNTLPVVQALTLRNSMSSGKMTEERKKISQFFINIP